MPRNYLHLYQLSNLRLPQDYCYVNQERSHGKSQESAKANENARAESDLSWPQYQ
jgi:hypothetical protein